MNAHVHTIPVRNDGGEPAVACPQRIELVPVTTCVRCELCEGLDLDPKLGHVGVRCEAAAEAGSARETKVARIMTEHVVSVGPDTAIENVRWALLDRGIGAVPVVEDGKTIGIVSKSDLLREGEDAIAFDAAPRAEPAEEGSERELSGLCARDVMTPVVFAALVDASIADAAAHMISRRVHHLPVVDRNGSLRGIVSALDFVRWLAASAR